MEHFLPLQKMNVSQWIMATAWIRSIYWPSICHLILSPQSIKQSLSNCSYVSSVMLWWFILLILLLYLLVKRIQIQLTAMLLNNIFCLKGNQVEGKTKEGHPWEEERSLIWARTPNSPREQYISLSVMNKIDTGKNIVLVFIFFVDLITADIIIIKDDSREIFLERFIAEISHTWGQTVIKVYFHLPFLSLFSDWFVNSVILA